MAELSAQVRAYVDLIEKHQPHYGSVDEAIGAARSLTETIGGPLSGRNAENFSAAAEFVKAQASKSIEILRSGSLIKSRPDWYKGPKAMDRHWPALRSYFANQKRWSEGAIASIDATSNEVVSLLSNPADSSFRCRGLVVGYVQSGKTANMTAVIAKAVDAGYNLVIVLAGVTNKLRSQTQRRLEADVIERYPQHWLRYTRSDEDGDFVIPRNDRFTKSGRDHPQIIVMKKIVSRLADLLQTIRNTAAVPAILNSIRALIIDDECDQASVNANEDDDPAKTNKLIREIINSLPAVSYVGYTATPFANVFINPFPRNQESLDDLYPEDFITALPRPAGYFGTREVFGYPPDDASDETGPAAGRDMVRVIPDKEPNDEVSLLRPPRGQGAADFSPRVTASLEKAILWFLISCAIRRWRGQGGEHMTMLVHVSQAIKQHELMDAAIKEWFELNKEFLRAGAGSVWKELLSVWHEETSAVPLDGHPDPSGLSLSVLHPYLIEALDALEIVIENSTSLERLNYEGEVDEDGKWRYIPRTYIVIGGSVLARGLTLEGLAVSFFLRTTVQYDSLLQMGRWFGYRGGYSDLPRLWASEDLISSFRALAQIEEEIREEIRIYKDRQATPKDFAVRVRAIPGMAITSAGKMRHAHRTNISYQGRHIQTIRFDHRDLSQARRNWEAAGQLIRDARKSAEESVGPTLMRGVPLSVIRRFLTEYEISNHHVDLRKDLLLAYIDKSSSLLLDWNLGLILPEKSGLVTGQELGDLGFVSANRRSRLQSPDTFADIKALMSKSDILVDVEGTGGLKGGSWREFKSRRPQNRPLLLIYPIHAKSEPTPRNSGPDSRRVALEAVMDLIGIGIVFPGSEDLAGDFYSVELEVPAPEEFGVGELSEVHDE